MIKPLVWNMYLTEATGVMTAGAFMSSLVACSLDNAVFSPLRSEVQPPFDINF
jgi:hypothetical protein